MTTLHEQLASLRADRATALARMENSHARSNAIIARVQAEKRDITKDEQRQLDSIFGGFDKAEADMKAIAAEIDELERTPQPRVVPPAPIGASPYVVTGSRSAPAGTRVPSLVDMSAPVRPVNYGALFGAAPSTREDVPFNEYLHAIEVGDAQVLRRVRNANTSSVGADGGFAVGGAWSAALLNAVTEQSQFLRYCRVLPLTGQSTTFPVINDTSRATGPGDLTAERVAEGVAATRQTVKFRELVLTARKSMVYWSASSELLQDSTPGTSEAMVASAASTLAMQIDREIWTGTGAGQMQGITGAACAIVHAKDGGQSASTVTYTNLSGMVSRLLPQSWNNAVWVLHPSTLTALFGVYLATGASGGIPLPLSQGADGSYRLFGRPMVVSDFAAPLSSQGDIALVDMSFYAVGIREDLRFEVSRDFLFSSDEVAFRVIQRRDGQPILSSAVTPARGSTTLSPFVVLQAR